MNDITAEGTESFTVTLTENSEVVINNTASTAIVVIIDDDGRPINLNNPVIKSQTACRWDLSTYPSQNVLTKYTTPHETVSLDID